MARNGKMGEETKMKNQENTMTGKTLEHAIKQIAEKKAVPFSDIHQSKIVALGRISYAFKGTLPQWAKIMRGRHLYYPFETTIVVEVYDNPMVSKIETFGLLNKEPCNLESYDLLTTRFFTLIGDATPIPLTFWDTLFGDKKGDRKNFSYRWDRENLSYRLGHVLDGEISGSNFLSINKVIPIYDSDACYDTILNAIKE